MQSSDSTAAAKEPSMVRLPTPRLLEPLSDSLAETLLIEARAPTLEEYQDLCAAVGWSETINFAAAPASLAHSLFSIVVLDRGRAVTRPVGMGRIVGDGALFFYIQDIIVRPEYQGLGVGRKIVERLMGWLHVHAPERAFVGLFAAEGKDSFYARFGFMRHPALTGMFQVIPRLQGEYE
jgi:GNAT superfamily N-acetyltransferase